MSWIDAITPLVSTVVGAGIALSGQWLTERRQSSAKQRSDWAAFQRQTLVDLQDALMQIYGLHAHYIFERAPDQEQSEAEERAIGEKLLMLNGQARVLISRLDNRDLAQQTIRVMQLVVNGQIEEADSTGTNAFLDLVAELGQEIRRWNHAG